MMLNGQVIWRASDSSLAKELHGVVYDIGSRSHLQLVKVDRLFVWS